MSAVFFHAPEGTREDTLPKERWARSEAWDLAKKLYKLRGDMDQNRATFFSPSEFWRFPAPSSIKPEEREFVVDSRASMHMLSRKDLNSAELETIRVSRNSTKVLTANGEVQTNEEATVYVKDLDPFVTV